MICKPHTILQWRSLNDKRDDLALIIRDTDPDIIALSETWLNGSNNERMLGFSIARRDRKE